MKITALSGAGGGRRSRLRRSFRSLWPARRVRRRSARRTTRLTGAGQHLRVAAGHRLDRSLGQLRRRERHLRPDRVGRRDRRDHEPHRRLRGERRAADARPVHDVQGLRPDPGPSRRPRSSTTSRAPRSRLKLTGPDPRRHLPRQDHPVERRRSSRSTPASTCRTEDHARYRSDGSGRATTSPTTSRR